jgi:hypothetical protein
MKKILFGLFILIALKSSGQITLDATVTPWNGFGYDFYAVQISPTETKWITQDTATNTFNILNMDFSPYITNIAVPEPFYVVGNNYHMEVIYVSRALFDCDTSNIEYAYTAVGNFNKPFRIIRTDGTQLFQLDSAVGVYCIGCLQGSNDLRPVRNTSAGTKLFLHIQGGNGQLTNIYSLCGSLPEDIADFSQSNSLMVQASPNPSSGSVTFKVDPPDNIHEFELVIVDINAREIKRIKISGHIHDYVLDVSTLSNGSYYYSLCTKTKLYQSGKFIITK